MQNAPAFLSGGGEMGRLIQEYDWSKTSLGPIKDWPSSLRTLLHMMLTSRFPMLIFWSRDLITFYNDAFRPSLGNNGKHPSSLGQRGEESWAESWPVIGPMIYGIMAGNEAVWFEDQKLPLYRDGKMGYAYWTYSFSPLHNDDQEISGILVTCAETTKAVESLQSLADLHEQQEMSIEAAELGTWDLNSTTGNFTANKRLKEWFGLAPDEEIALPLAIEVIAEADRQRVTSAINRAMDKESGGLYEEQYTIIHPRTGKERIVQAKGRAQFDESGKAVRLNGTLRDITQQILFLKEKEEEQSRLLALFEQSSIGIAIIGKKDLTFEMANPFYGILVDRHPEELIGKPLLEALPEIAGQGFDVLLNKVIDTGEPFIALAIPVDIKRGQSIQTIYVDLAYQPMRNNDKKVTGVLVIATDVTHSVLSRKAIEASEAKFRTLISEAPFATALYTGEEHTIELANEAMIKLWGKTPAVIGQQLITALPEIEGQDFINLLNGVRESGKAFSTTEYGTDLVVDGQMQHFWFNFTYKPIFDDEGKVYAILNMAVDVSEQVRARKDLDELASALKEAIELAQLATWRLDLATEKISYSHRLQQWLGIQESDLNLDSSPMIHPDDRQRVASALREALAPGSKGSFDEVYKIVHQQNGEIRIIHASGRTILDANGTPIAISGTAQDVTIQKELQLALETEVAVQTKELAQGVKNFAEMNESLAELNRQLQRSNEELAQYAYVASHDLQEPLRKIRLFSSVLGSEQSGEQRAATVEKIKRSTERMSLLINDLLEFSRLLNSELLFKPIDLNKVVQAAVEDFELIIAEKGAQISVADLPVIEGVSLQFNQLFTNLIGNSLKFTQPGQTPVVTIDTHEATPEEIAAHIEKPVPGMPYHLISISDNGIGFDPVHVNQIFDVFKRLHGKSEYSGSGIGLAICRRVVQNHHGALYAEAEQGAGASFYILLPEKQANVVMPDAM